MRPGPPRLLDIEPLHVAAWVESLSRGFSPPSVTQWLAAVRMLFDWLVVGQVLAVNPAAAVRGPKVVGLRDRALIACWFSPSRASAPRSE